jgi:phage baseplate assembly protein gpV
MDKKNSYLVVIVAVMTMFLFTGCEGIVGYTGVIYDAQTEEPLDSVQCVIVAFRDRDFHTYSDSTGNYLVSTPLVGCVPNCGKYEVEFSKRGYKTQTIKAPANVYLEKE